MTRTLTLLAALLCGTAAFSHEFKVGSLEIIHPHMNASGAQAHSAGGFMTIVNQGSESDRLIGVTAGFAAESMVHETAVDASGVARMNAVPQLEIPAGSTVELMRGGYHVMFMGLSGPITEGETLPATLTFEKAGSVEVEFSVDPAGAEEDHSDMDAMTE
jgi:periplasmic copper chaperone A